MTKIDMDTTELKFNAHGLIPVIVQDGHTGEVLMMAWANKESLQRTAECGELVFWSRSRGELWHKGETSGNTMTLLEMRADCDGDTLLAIAEPAGPACHTGARSCFFSTVGGGDACEGTFPGRLYRYLTGRKNDDPSESYTARLIASGMSRVAQKIGEEGVETALACALENKKDFIYEAADLMYHLEAACAALDVPFYKILKELASRHKGEKI